MVTRAAHCVLFWALLLILQGAGTFATPSTPSCPRYVQENGNLNCTCTGSCSGGVQPTFSWQQGASSVSQNARLFRTNVRRVDEGTRFTCHMMCLGVSTSTEYVLQVSYGPTDEHLTIHATGSEIVGANNSFVLTCRATEVNPTPTYAWNDGPCDAILGNTCAFIPQLEHDKREVTCKATSGDSKSKATALKTFTLDLKYPPPKEPLLSGYTKETPLKPGDIVTCTVTGGNPLVSTVYLNCTDQAFPCETLTTGDSRTTSCKVDFKEDKADIKKIECSCSAVWEEEPQLYVHVATDTIKVEKPHPAGGKHGSQAQQEPSSHGAGTVSRESIVGGITAILVITIAVIAVYVIKKHMNPRYERPPPRREDEHLYTSLQV